MTILYYILGENSDIYVQAYFSILSFKRQLQKDDRIVIITSNPKFFNHLNFAEIIPVDEKRITEWKGKHNFFWRTKLKAIETICTLYPADDMLYIDCDTFLYGDFTALKQEIKNGKSFMDGNEGHPSKTTHKHKRLFNTLKGKNIADITISEKHDMWCAGVCGLPSEKKSELISTALSLCDGMLEENVDPEFIEQYSLSIALKEKSDLTSSKPYIAHYWSNKPQWINEAKQLLLTSLFTNADLDTELQLFSEIQLNQIPIYIKKHKTNKTIKKLADKYFPDDKQSYVNTNS
ncbi:MAG: hypothetical protein II956_11760 [Bacteroidales bacterium]|nr:hypothetical protein [Bacteroidales bacterium]